MNSLELKNKIIRQIDSLDEKELEQVYLQLQDILRSSNSYQLSEEENSAIDEALKVSEKEETYSRNEVIFDAKNKFPNLNFR